MTGNIYTSQRCPLCMGKLLHDERRSGCFCQEHPAQRASSGFMVRFGRSITARFSEYDAARRFLTGLRFKMDEGTFDSRDYRRAAPLGFSNLVRKFLDSKRPSMRPRGFESLERDLGKGEAAWGQRNVKTIGYGDFEDLLAAHANLSGKTRHNLMLSLAQFFRWLCRREGLAMPDMPKVEYSLGWREIIDRETQSAILDELRRLYWDRNPRIWIAVNWLATYVSIRPVELLALRERDVNVEGMLVLRPQTTKEKKPKLVPLLPEDIELVRSLPRGLPDMHFFRHTVVRGATKPGDSMSHDTIWRAWRKACNNLGISGVDLYGGTRHSTATALRQYFTRDELRESGTMHSTNEAFDRYVQGQVQPSLTIYAKARETARPTRPDLKILPIKTPRR